MRNRTLVRRRPSLAPLLIAWLVASVLLILAPAAFAAGTANLSWSNPTLYVDGVTPIGASDITQTRIAYGTCNGNAFGAQSGQVVVPGNGTSGQVPNLAPGTYCFEAFTTALGVESAASNVAQLSIPQPAPNAPLLNTPTLATTQGTVFELIKELDRFVMLPVGTIPLGTPCDATQNADGLYVVPRAKVSFTGNVQPMAVLGICS